MEQTNRLSDWVPLLGKLVWPLFFVIALVLFNKEAKELYDVFLTGIKSGRSVEIGFIKLGEAADKTSIGELSAQSLPIKGIGGPAGVVRKGSELRLLELQKELEQNPSKAINTLLLPDNIVYSTDLLKQYVGTLGLKYVVFQRNEKFDGWISSGAFVAQLSENSETLRYDSLKRRIVGISKQTVSDGDSVKQVLEQMQEMHMDSMPVVDQKGRWLFFANREEILARMMTDILLEQEK
jgi:hypothetical protein